MNLDKINTPTVELIREALSHDGYSNDGCDYTSSQINGPPQRTWLAVNHEEVKDPMRQYASMQGTAMHSFMEELAKKKEGLIAERRFKWTFKGLGLGDRTDIIFGGKPDIVWEENLDDWKFVSPRNYSIQAGGSCKPEYVAQAQMNSWLAIKNGVPVKAANVIHWLRDWSIDNAFLNPSYPQEPFKVFSFPIEPLDKTEAEIRFKILEHEQARIGNPRPCTKEERWQDPPRFACKKPANKRARKLFDTFKEAKENLKDGEVVDERSVEPIRCMVRGVTSWCGFTRDCPQCKAEGMKTAKGMPLGWKGLYE